MSRILIVDDSPTVRAVMSAALSYKKATIFQAGTAVEAVQIYESDKPDLIFLDINLPGADGLVFLRKLRQRENIRSTRVIMLTGDTSRDTIKRALAEGADDFIAKPFASVLIRHKTDKYLN
jgi:CheY-like chemotaxis protein